MVRWSIVKLLVGAALVVGFVAGLIVAGRWGLERIRGQDRYRISLAELDCPIPPGLSKSEFVDEVQYLARLPAELKLLDDNLPDLLRAAFAKHAWVEAVDKIEIEPPRQVTVRLRFRTPVLAVPWEGKLRAVDGDGVLLPANAPAEELPRFDGKPKPPQGPAGMRWGDPAVEQAARQATSKTSGR
jgi:hypothetical protein